jgi:hypothetical protein
LLEFSEFVGCRGDSGLFGERTDGLEGGCGCFCCLELIRLCFLGLIGLMRAFGIGIEFELVLGEFGMGLCVG